MTIACLAVGVQGGHALGSLALCEPEPMATAALVIEDVPDANEIDIEEPPEVEVKAEPMRVAWCSRPALCFVDLDELSNNPGALPRGMRLVPDGEGLRIDGARGLLTRVGLRNGDVLLAIDDHPLHDGEGLDLLAGATDRGGFSLRYRRGGRVFAKRINFVAS